jgi:8-oxo-dGTP diphosphatase
MTTVVAGLMQRAGEVLIGQRKPGGAHGLKWEFPGGKIEPGETPGQALARELREELAIDAVIGEELTRYEYSYPGKAPILLIFLAVDRWQGEPENRVFEQIRWESRDGLGRRDFLSGDERFLGWLSTQVQKLP